MRRPFQEEEYDDTDDGKPDQRLRNIWNRSIATKDKRICQILDSIIHSEPEGLPVILNRNKLIVECKAMVA